MNAFQNLTGCVAVVAISMFGLARAQEFQQGKAMVRRIIGTAKYSREAGVWIPIRVTDRLSARTKIQFDAESQVDLFLGVNGPTLRVTADSTVALDELSFIGGGEDIVIETKLNLFDGRILGSVKKLAAASVYQVKTPTGGARIRATDYDIRTRKNSQGKRESVYLCASGLITGEDGGVTFSLGDGQGFKPGGVFDIPPAELAQYFPRDGTMITDSWDPFPPIPPLPPPDFIIHISPVTGLRAP
jgi:hypothetical protein